MMRIFKSIVSFEIKLLKNKLLNDQISIIMV